MRWTESVLPTLPPCQAPVWGRGGHAQTLWGYLLPSPVLDEPGERWRVDLGDGDFAVARVHEAPGASTVHLLFHGLGGDIESTYMHRSVAVARRQGATAVRVNLRSAGEGYAEALGLYHSGRSADLAAVVRAARGRWPGACLVASGFSMSGNLVLNLLGRHSGVDLPDAAFVVNPAMNLTETSRRLGDGFNRVYDRRFVRDLMSLLEKKHRAGQPTPPLRRRPRTLAEFDELVTCRAAGFRTREEYYRECSSMAHVHRVTTPTLVLTAEEDPFVSAEDFRKARWSSSTRVRIERHGGHLGYLQRSGGGRPGYSRWLDVATERAWRELSPGSLRDSF